MTGVHISIYFGLKVEHSNTRINSEISFLFSADSFSDSRFVAQATYPVRQTIMKTLFSYQPNLVLVVQRVGFFKKDNLQQCELLFLINRYVISIEIFTKLSCVRRGFRSVPLNNDFSEPLEMSCLLIFLDNNKPEDQDVM